MEVGDEVVFTRPGYYAASFPGMDGETVIASTNHVMYTVIGRKPAIYGALHIQDFGPAHEPVGVRVGEKEAAEFNASRHVTPAAVGATAGEFKSLIGLLNYKKN